MKAAFRAIRGVAAGVRRRPGVFAAVVLAVLCLDVFLPPLLLSLVRKRVDFYTFNPWLSRLPAYLASADIPLEKKLDFLPRLALFWFSADSPYGGTDWGYAVDVSDVARFLFTALVVGAYFALWSERRGRAALCGFSGRAGRNGGFVGALAGVLGLSTGPCSVMGCGAPVIPVLGLVFAGLSSEALAWMAGISRLATAAILLAMTAGVAYLGWLVGPEPAADGPRFS